MNKFPKTNDDVLQIRLPKELKAEAKKAAEELGVDLSDVIRERLVELVEASNHHNISHVIPDNLESK